MRTKTDWMKKYVRMTMKAGWTKMKVDWTRTKADWIKMKVDCTRTKADWMSAA